MATSRFSPAASVASQIRNGALGVNGGGTQGRMAQMHKGVGLRQNSGGMNARGSGTKPFVPPRRPAPAPARPSGMRPSEAGGINKGPSPQIAAAMRTFSGPRTFKDASGNIRRTAAWTEHLRKAGALGGSQTPGVATPQPANPAPGPQGPPTTPIDYRMQAGYMQGMANLNLEAGSTRAEIQSQLADNTRQYGKARTEAKGAYSDDVTRDNAMLAARGILSSGMREDTNADRFKEFDTILAGIEEQYGTIATQRLNQALQQLSEWETLQRQSLEQEAAAAYQQAYPAAPLPEPPPPPAPAPPPPPPPPAPAPPARPSSPAPRMTLQQAVDRFNGPRTFRDAQGNVRRTAAWANFLRQNGLL